MGVPLEVLVKERNGLREILLGVVDCFGVGEESVGERFVVSNFPERPAFAGVEVRGSDGERLIATMDLEIHYLIDLLLCDATNKCL